MDSLIWQLLLQLFLIFLNAVFACAEIAVLSVNELSLKRLANEGNKRAVRLQKLTSHPAKFLATIQVAITLSGFLGSAFAADNFSELIVNGLIKIGAKIPPATLHTLSVILITIILSYITLVFGELVPKRIAMKKTERIALGLSAPVTFISKLFAPIVWLLTVSTNGILRLLGISPEAEEEEVTEEEIRFMVDVGSENGAIDVSEKEIINNVFEFDDISLDELCTHRTEISMLWSDESDKQWEETITQSRHSMYPVCGESVDDIIGVLSTKDYFRLKDKSRESVMHRAVRPAYFVPESISAAVLFANMKKTHNYFAVVLDEHGGMSGIVTMMDLLEQIVGDFEYDDDPEPEASIERIDSNTWKILGQPLLEDITEKMGVEFDDDEDFDTFSGLVFDAYGFIPPDGSVFEVDAHGIHIKVTQIEDHKVQQATVCLLNPETKSEQAETSGM